MTQREQELLDALKGLHQAVIDAHVLDVKKRYSLCVASSVASKAIHEAESTQEVRAMRLTLQELSTILAALRFYQGDEPRSCDPEIQQIANCGGNVVAMTSDEIDALCEKLNCANAIEVLPCK